MKRHLVIACLTVGLAIVAVSCRAPDEETQASSANSNSTNGQPAAAAEPAPGAPTENPHVAAPPPAQVAADPQPPMKQIVPPPPPIPGGPAGKIVVPIKRIDFGLQPKSKSLTRTFSIRNEGKAELQIAAVEPS